MLTFENIFLENYIAKFTLRRGGIFKNTLQPLSCILGPFLKEPDLVRCDKIYSFSEWENGQKVREGEVEHIFWKSKFPPLLGAFFIALPHFRPHLICYRSHVLNSTEVSWREGFRWSCSRRSVFISLSNGTVSKLNHYRVMTGQCSGKTGWMGGWRSTVSRSPSRTSASRSSMKTGFNVYANTYSTFGDCGGNFIKI